MTTSKDLPIIFSRPMVRALLEGRKTQTRRIIKGGLPPAPAMDAINPKNVARHAAPYFDSYRGQRRTPENPEGMSRNWCWWTRDDRQCLPTINVRYQPGDCLWVRESHRLTDCECIEACRGPGHVWYDATEEGYRNVSSNKLRPSIHMPRWASRITLEVTSVKVERLQDISEKDAIAEGCAGRLGPNPDFPDEWDPSPQEEFSELWKSLHGKDAWEANPFVVAITFRVIKANIDSPEARAAA